MSDTYCGECKQLCDWQVESDGIGAYEFWGAKGFDAGNDIVSSKCCDGDVFEDEDCLIEFVADSEDADGRGDWLHDQAKDRKFEEEMERIDDE